MCDDEDNDNEDLESDLDEDQDELDENEVNQESNDERVIAARSNIYYVSDDEDSDTQPEDKIEIIKSTLDGHY